MVLVPHYNGTVVLFGTINLVPSILQPSDHGGRTVTKNANHYKTCIHKYSRYYKYIYTLSAKKYVDIFLFLERSIQDKVLCNRGCT
jgi:hypothetical protein